MTDELYGWFLECVGCRISVFVGAISVGSRCVESKDRLLPFDVFMFSLICHFFVRAFSLEFEIIITTLRLPFIFERSSDGILEGSLSLSLALGKL